MNESGHNPFAAVSSESDVSGVDIELSGEATELRDEVTPDSVLHHSGWGEDINGDPKHIAEKCTGDNPESINSEGCNYYDRYANEGFKYPDGGENPDIVSEQKFAQYLGKNSKGEPLYGYNGKSCKIDEIPEGVELGKRPSPRGF